MAELHEVLITVRLRPENLRRLEQALAPARLFVCPPEDRQAIAACIDRVDGAILEADADEQILSGRKLKWIHCCHAGLDRTAGQEVFSRGIVLTGSSGRSAPALAEHVFALLLSLTYDMPGILRAQENRQWCAAALGERRAVFGKTLGIVGLGKTGQAVAALGKAFGMKVLAWRRRPEEHPCADRVYAADRGEGLRPLLESSDFVVLCASLNNETRHLLNDTTLGWMKPTAFLINVGRGALVEEAALVRALNRGTIAGAGLDVFETEPLPRSSPLWDAPNVILTPHTTPSLPDREDRSLEYVLRNIEAYRKDEGYVNRLTPRDVYTPDN